MATVADKAGTTDAATGRTRRGGSRFWTAAFNALFALTPPLLPRTARRFGEFGIVQELIVRGRRSGAPRSVFVCVYDIDGRLYVGHPTGASNWTRNLDAAAAATLVRRDGSRTAVRAIRLDEGPERDALLAAIPGQQVAPFAVLYRGARQHVAARGVYYRLEPAARNPV